MREPTSCEYCIRKNKKAKFIRANDFAIYLKEYYNPIINSDRTNKIFDEYLTDEYYLNVYNVYQIFSNQIQNIMNDSLYLYNNKTIRFYFRDDYEGSTHIEQYKQIKNFDVSFFPRRYIETCDIQLISFWPQVFLSIIDSSDIVFTDRLHVTLSGFHLGKKIFAYDNNYGKISGVYEQSLKCFNQIHVLHDQNIPINLSTIKLIPGFHVSKHLESFLNLSFSEFKSKYNKFLSINH